MLSIPIIAEYDGKALDRAIKDFNQLETAGEKAQFLIKKAAIPAAAALTGVTTALTLAVKAAADDEAEQAQLALTLQNVTGATEKQVKATEDMIAAMSRATGTADSDLRPALAVLITGTKDVATATDALRLAQDIATGSGKSLGEVSDALAKAYGGNMRGLQALSPEIKLMIQDGASLEDVMKVLSGTFGGAAAKAADTAAGKFKILTNTLGETKESIGAALLPAVEAVLPVIQKFADWAQKHPDTFLTIAGAISGIAVAILAVNTAMALNPFSIIMIGVGALVTAIVIAYQKFETFRDVVNNVLNGLMRGFEIFANSWINTVNAIISGINLISPFTDIPKIPTVSLPTIGGGPSYSGASERAGMPATGFTSPTMPAMTAPLPTVAGGGGSSGSGSIFKGGGGGGGATRDSATILPDFFGGVNLADVTINVNGGDPNAVVQALRDYMRQNGSVPITTANLY